MYTDVFDSLKCKLIEYGRTKVEIKRDPFDDDPMYIEVSNSPKKKLFEVYCAESKNYSKNPNLVKPYDKEKIESFKRKGKKFLKKHSLLGKKTKQNPIMTNSYNLQENIIGYHYKKMLEYRRIKENSINIDGRERQVLLKAWF